MNDLAKETTMSDEVKKFLEKIATRQLRQDLQPNGPDDVVEGTFDWMFTAEEIRAARELLA